MRRPPTVHGLWVLALGLVAAMPLRAENLRIATYDVDLSYSAPGMVLDRLTHGRGDGIKATVQVIAALDADILLLTGIDYDAANATVDALAALVRAAGVDYPYRLALRPNSGVNSGLDLNGDGALNSPEDALAWGRFPGNGGMAILSRHPIDRDGLRDLTGFRWADLPGHLMPEFFAKIAPDLPLSTGGHWIVPIALPEGRQVQLLAYAATAPIFDDGRDLNGRRNHDEAALWRHLLDGTLPGQSPPTGSFVILGKSNLDPMDGDGRREALRGLLTHPKLQDPEPAGPARHRDQGHRGDAGIDTAFFDRAGGLRVDLILPSRDLTVTGAGAMWLPATDLLEAALAQASRHRPVWVDIETGG
jgi:hypothetical protein